jgi:hypothetical protein
MRNVYRELFDMLPNRVMALHCHATRVLYDGDESVRVGARPRTCGMLAAAACVAVEIGGSPTDIEQFAALAPKAHRRAKFGR